jgi:glycerophosphoryl diester phosphodiesterase
MRPLPRTLSALTSLAIGASAIVGVTIAAASPAAALPNCPIIYAHGGYPADNDWTKDRVRQPNNPQVIDKVNSWGAQGVEGDLQLTKDGYKAVMWHNGKTTHMSGAAKPITDFYWASGADPLNGRTIDSIADFPGRGSRIYTFREWLVYLKTKNMKAVVEVKDSAHDVLFSGDATIKNRAWNEIFAPLDDSDTTREIKFTSQDATIKAELFNRLYAANLGYMADNVNRPVWPDKAPWNEGAAGTILNSDGWTPDPSGNYANWQTVLNQNPVAIATSWPKQYAAWLQGKCGGGGGGNIKLVNPASGRCLDVAGAGTADGTQMQIQDCNGSGAQAWAKQDRGGNNFNLINSSSGKCLDVASSSQDPGAKVQIWECNGSAAQGWYFEALQDWPNHYVLRSNNSNQCLDIAAAGTTNGTRVQQYTCNYTGAQFWEEVPA